jgi:uncharacterized protein with HEPN domain
LYAVDYDWRKFEKSRQSYKWRFLSGYPEIEWKKVKGLRDIITHQYFDVNVEAIFDVCDEKLPELIKTVTVMLVDMQQ